MNIGSSWAQAQVEIEVEGALALADTLTTWLARVYRSCMALRLARIIRNLALFLVLEASW